MIPTRSECISAHANAPSEPGYGPNIHTDALYMFLAAVRLLPTPLITAKTPPMSLPTT
jgi:hypothetical protein